MLNEQRAFTAICTEEVLRPPCCPVCTVVLCMYCADLTATRKTNHERLTPRDDVMKIKLTIMDHQKDQKPGNVAWTSSAGFIICRLMP